MQEQEKIELRSEKVRNVIRQKPPFLIRWGTVFVIMLLLLLGMIAYLFLRIFK